MEKKYKLAVGADHAGLALKRHLVAWLEDRGHEVRDMGTHSEESCHYTDFAAKVARAVDEGRVELGLLVCGTGQGMAMTANRLPGVRAAVVAEPFSARSTREHNDANVLCMGGRVIGEGLAELCLEAWLGAEFQAGRHGTRLQMMHRFATEAAREHTAKESP